MLYITGGNSIFRILSLLKKTIEILAHSIKNRGMQILQEPMVHGRLVLYYFLNTVVNRVLSPHQRNFFLQWIVINTETHDWSECDERKHIGTPLPLKGT